MSESRQKKGIIVGVIGLFCNVALGVGKLIAGIVTGSVSIATDAANNLTDSGASVATITSFVLGGKKADKEHPYGHGRYEYIASFIIGVIIVSVGIQFFIESIKRIIAPTDVTTNTLGIVILAASIAVKIFMFILYRIKAKSVNSDALAAAATDAFFDCLITSVVLLSFILNKYVSFPIDGICGILVSGVVLIGGGKVVLETIGKLLGNGSDPLLSEKLYELVLTAPYCVGAHDLSLHDYGPNFYIGSVHAEFDKEMSITDAHKIIDEVETKARELYNVELCVHVDPIDMSDPVLNSLRTKIKETIKFYKQTSIHELKLDNEQKAIAFDIKLPHKYDEVKSVLVSALNETIQKDFVDYKIDIEFDNA